jgi:hypothetical protein
MPTGITWSQRLARQILPRQPQDCCWYHRVDWHDAAGGAVRVACQIGLRRYFSEDHLFDRSLTLLIGVALPQLECLAALTLLEPRDSMQLSRPGGSWVNGQHRAQAMLEAGVKLTVVLRWAE